MRESRNNPGFSAHVLLDPAVDGGARQIAGSEDYSSPIRLARCGNVQLGKLPGGGNSPEFCGPWPLEVKLPRTMNRC